MVHQQNRRWFLSLIAVMVAFCVASVSWAQAKSEASGTKMITALKTAETSQSAVVYIKGDQELVYTSVKQPYPSGVILYFPNTALYLEDVQLDSVQNSQVIEAVLTSELTEKGTTSRIEILLKQDVPYSVSLEDGTLKVAFPKPETAPAVKTAAPAQPERMADTPPAPITAVTATRLKTITFTELERGVQINLIGDGTIRDFKSFTVGNPARIVFDIDDIKGTSSREEMLAVDTPWVKRVRHYGYPDRLRVVLDTYPQHLDAFSTRSTEDGLMILVGAKVSPAAAEPPSAEAAPAPAAEAAPVPVADAKPAWINRLDFSSGEAGKSTIIIGTTHPVTYDLVKATERQLRLKLFNTRLPSYRQRPLITTRFNSAVDRVTPVQTETMKDRTEVVIELRESVPYRVEQVDNLLLVNFEASTIPPRPFEQAKMPTWQKVLEDPSVPPMEAMEPKPTAPPTAAPQQPAVAPQPPAAVAAAPTPPTAPGQLPTTADGQPLYTGEKIALDFYDTDIKNVFRILREVSGKNFAIDKNVTGKVTLTLENPVPWDQVLALVLKMNQLGMIYEGDIVRIATLQTLAKEEELRRGKLKATLKAKEQQKVLEPLYTEYIPISYANASSEIRPLLSPLLTKGRGKISVDDRTNLIIITDTADVIAQAKELVMQLDAVTPQVIIEARVVEASTAFTRDLGIQWSATVGPQQSGNLGGQIQYDAAVNLLRGSNLGTIGLNFTKIGGFAMTLDAQLTASETQNKTKIISAPKVVTLDNKAATIKQGLQYPYNKLDADGNTTTEFIDIVLQLTVTPHVTPDDRISMNIKVTKSDLAGIVNNQQSFNTIESENELLDDDGETVVIAGILKTTATVDESGVPGLKNIPLLGWLFKNRGVIDNKQELLIFLTPRILRLEQRTITRTGSAVGG